MGRLSGILLTDLLYFSGTDATCTYMHAGVSAMGPDCPYPLQIRLGYLFGLLIGMAYAVSGQGTFAAYITHSWHCIILPK